MFVAMPFTVSSEGSKNRLMDEENVAFIIEEFHSVLCSGISIVF